MRSILTFAICIAASQCFCQSESEQNYVLNSVKIHEDSVGNSVIVTNYYTLRNNIDNKKSSGYVADKPTLDQITDAAINMNADFFLINKATAMLNMIVIENKPERHFVLLTPPYMEKKEIKCSLKGDISENRAAELITEKYDPSARIDGNTLYFNNKKLKIFSNAQIKAQVHEIIKREKLTEPTLSNTNILTQDELGALVLAQTRKGGKLDFFSATKGQEYASVEVKPGVYASKISAAFYNWGKEVADLGVKDVASAIAIYAKVKGSEPDERERDYIQMGFNKVMEQ